MYVEVVKGGGVEVRNRHQNISLLKKYTELTAGVNSGLGLGVG